MKDTAHMAHLELPLDVCCTQIIVEACIGVGVALCSYLPKATTLTKIRLADHAKERSQLHRHYDEFDARPSFENFMANRGRMRSLRLKNSILAPPSSL